MEPETKEALDKIDVLNKTLLALNSSKLGMSIGENDLALEICKKISELIKLI